MTAPILGKDPIYWNVVGVPVAWLPTPEGGCVSRAFDTADPAGRPVTFNWVREEGMECSRDEFEQLKRMCAMGLRVHAASNGPE